MVFMDTLRKYLDDKSKKAITELVGLVDADAAELVLEMLMPMFDAKKTAVAWPLVSVIVGADKGENIEFGSAHSGNLVHINNPIPRFFPVRLPQTKYGSFRQNATVPGHTHVGLSGNERSDFISLGNHSAYYQDFAIHVSNPLDPLQEYGTNDIPEDIPRGWNAYECLYQRFTIKACHWRLRMRQVRADDGEHADTTVESARLAVDVRAHIYGAQDIEHTNLGAHLGVFDDHEKEYLNAGMNATRMLGPLAAPGGHGALYGNWIEFEDYTVMMDHQHHQLFVEGTEIEHQRTEFQMYTANTTWDISSNDSKHNTPDHTVQVVITMKPGNVPSVFLFNDATQRQYEWKLDLEWDLVFFDRRNLGGVGDMPTQA